LQGSDLIGFVFPDT